MKKEDRRFMTKVLRETAQHFYQTTTEEERQKIIQDIKEQKEKELQKTQ